MSLLKWPVGILLFLFVLLPTVVAAQPCEVPDNGSGTVNLPPDGCGYVSPDDLHIMIDGLPPSATIRVDASHRQFFNVVRHPGGNLGGEVEEFDSMLSLHLEGTGPLAGFVRDLNMQVHCEVHTAPRNPGDTIQHFETEMVFLQGEIFGDPDFDQLRVKAGSAFGLPSPGETTLTQLPSGQWNVDSFFDITYEIDFVGAPGSILGGHTGTTQAQVTMGSGIPANQHPDPCVVADNGTGTVSLPPEGCGYVSPQDLHRMIDGLPTGTEIIVAASHAGFFNVQTTPGGSLGGEVESFDSILLLELHGTGQLQGYFRVMEVLVHCETHTAPRNPGDPVQTFDTEMFLLGGQLQGDPDFEMLRVQGGSGSGLPSPGETTLTQLPTGDWNVDSFFDITYQIDYVGAPGGPLGGVQGSTTATLRMQAGQPIPLPPEEVCVVQDNGNGSADLPPEGCGYVSPADLHRMIEGLPPGTEIHVAASHAGFFVTQRIELPQGGEQEEFESNLVLQMQGTGNLSTFQRTIELQVACTAVTGPRDLSLPVQTFDNEMVSLQGQIFGDPDFELLQITAGPPHGLPPSPGETTLTQIPGGEWNVDSFFDITYQIDFQGAPGSQLEGMGGSTRGTIHMQAGTPMTTAIPESPSPEAKLASLNARPNPFNPSTTLSFSLESAGRVHLMIYDSAGRLMRRLIDVQLESGEHEVLWDGRDQAGRLLGSGAYFFELRLEGRSVDTQKVMLVK